jgi:hypothetical protein
MSVLVECDTALDSQGNEIHIDDAASGAKGYFCASCGAEMVAYKKRRRNESHFQHRPRFQGEEILCVWANETYRHKVAKQILQRLKRVKAPALYAIRPPDYEGPVDCILAETFIEAPIILAERCIFEDEQGKPCFARYLEFEEYQGEKELLVRPDLTFCNALHEPILFIEICATHSPNDQKLARLARLRIPTLEIRVPPCHFEADIQFQFTHTTRHSEWLYHPKQYVHNPDNGSADFTRGRGGKTSKHQRRLFEPGESIKCRTFQVEDALRGVRKRLAGAEYAERTTAIGARYAELRAEEGRITGLYNGWQTEHEAKRSHLDQETTRVDAELRAAYRKVTPTIQSRVAEQNREHSAAEAAVGREESELVNEQKTARAVLNHRFHSASTELIRDKATATAEFERAATALRAAEAALREQYAEHDDLCREEATLDREEAELRTEEKRFEAELRTVQIPYEEQEYALRQTTDQLAAAYHLERALAERKRFLTSKEEQARSGRLAI